MLLGKRVIEITSSDDQAIVMCLDRSTYQADIVVGADGIHSITRRKMLRDIISDSPKSHIMPEALGRGNASYAHSNHHAYS